MTTTGNTIGGFSASGVSVPARTNPPVFYLVMRAMRGWWKSKVPEQLAAIVGCDVRSARRYLSGNRTMGAEAVFALLRSDVGVKMVEAAVADLPAHEAKQFWMEMAMAVVKAQIRDNAP